MSEAYAKAADPKTGVCLRIYQQQDHDDNPRDWDNLGTMVCWHGRYSLGDQPNNYRFPEEFEDWWQDEGGPEGGVRLPLYLIDHSGISMRTTSFNDPWDSGQVGWIYVSHLKLQSEFGDGLPSVIDRIPEFLKGEVEVYDMYLRGDVYGYVLADAEGVEIDFCWGFFGDDFATNGMLDYIPAEYEHLLKELD